MVQKFCLWYHIVAVKKYIEHHPNVIRAEAASCLIQVLQQVIISADDTGQLQLQTISYLFTVMVEDPFRQNGDWRTKLISAKITSVCFEWNADAAGDKTF